MSKVRRAVVFSSISQYSVRLIGLASTMIVARLLTPDELGTFSIASAVVLMISEFRMLGAGAYLIREKELTDDKVRGALGLTMLTSWGLGALVIVSGPMVSNYYKLDPLALIFWILSIGFFLGPFISIPMALVSRQFNFKMILIADVVSSFTSLFVTVSLINLGYSFYSLAWGHIAKLVVEFFIVTLSGRFPLFWVPTFNGLRIIATFGVYNSLSNLFRKGVNLAPDIVIGKMGATSQVGIFSRGMGLVDFLAGTLQHGVGPVVLPYLSEARRSGDNIIDAYTRATVLVCGMVWPVLIVASVASLPVIRLFFGDQWDAAAPIASALAVWLVLRATHNFSNNLLIADGKERLMVLKDALILIVAFVLLIVAFPYGLQTVARSFLILGLFEIVLMTSLLAWVYGLKVIPFYASFLPNLCISIICGLATWAISCFVPFDAQQAWQPISVIALFLPPVWLLLLRIFNHPLYNEMASLVRGSVNKEEHQ